LQLGGIESQSKHPAHVDDPGRGLPEGQRERLDLVAVPETLNSTWLSCGSLSRMPAVKASAEQRRRRLNCTGSRLGQVSTLLGYGRPSISSVCVPR
jgi:hypothetical protein